MLLRVVVLTYFALFSVCLGAADNQSSNSRILVSELPAFEILQHARASATESSQPSAGWLMMINMMLATIIGLLSLRIHRVNSMKGARVFRDKDQFAVVFGSRRGKIVAKSSPAMAQSSLQQLIDLDDPLAIAHRLLAEHKYQKALEFLLSELALDSKRNDLRFCIIKIYAFRKEWALFDSQLDALESFGDQALLGEARKLYPKRALRVY